MDRDAVARLNFAELLTLLSLVVQEFVDRVGVSVTICQRTYNPEGIEKPESEQDGGGNGGSGGSCHKVAGRSSEES